jgi:hypothetical protein
VWVHLFCILDASRVQCDCARVCEVSDLGMESINQTCGRTLSNLADCLYITTNRCVCKHYTASRPVLLLFCNTLEKSKSKSTEESTSLQVKSIQVVLKYCNALLLLRYRTTLNVCTCAQALQTPRDDAESLQWANTENWWLFLT